MPGLSDDPDKRRRQLAGLAAGRRALALKVLAEDGHSPSTGAPSSPPASQGRGAESVRSAPESTPAGARAGVEPAAGELGVPVHTYGPPPTRPASEVPPPPAVPVAETEPDYETVTPRRGRLGRLVEGLRDGT